MKIAIAADHGGFILKNHIKDFLLSNGYDVKDFGVNDETSVDYPDFGRLVANEVSNGNFDRGILVCGTGQGIGITANKVSGIRCGIVSDVFSAKMIREHNNANMISLGERVVGKGLAIEIIKAFLDAEFEGGRHLVRVEKIEEK